MRTLFRHLGVLLATLVAWLILNDGVIQPWKVRASAAEVQDREVFILGDSHGKRIFLPGACNLAFRGDPLWLQHATLRELRQKGVNPRVVVASVNPVSVSQHVVGQFQADSELLASKSARIALLHPFFEGWEGTSGWQRVWRLVGELQAKPWRVPWTADGHRFGRGTRDLLNADERIALLGFDDEDWFTQHRFTTAAIDALAAEADAGSFELHLVGTPLHAAFYERIPTEGLQQYHTWLHGLESPQVTYHAHEQWPLPDSMFRDLNHLNQNGIEAFTEQLFSEL